MRRLLRNGRFDVDNNQWVNLYDRAGHLQGRYNPRTQQLIIRERKVDTPHELSIYHISVATVADKSTTGGRQLQENMLT